MVVHVQLRWSEGEARLDVVDGPDGLVALVDPRLSQHQVEAVCSELADGGETLVEQWRGLVGLSPEGGPAR